MLSLVLRHLLDLQGQRDATPMLKIPISPLTVFAWLPWHYGPLFTCPPPVFPLLSIRDDMVNITRLPWQHAFNIPLAFSVPLASQNKQPAQESWRKRRNSSINPANKENVCKYHQFTDYIFSCRANVGSQSTQSIIYVHMYCILCLNLLHLACCAILNTTPWYYKMHLNLINSACWVILKDSLK